MNRAYYLVITAAIILFDIWTKWLVINRIALYDAIPVIPGFFQLVHIRNSGAAFGLGANASSNLVPIALTGGALLVLIFVAVYAFRTAVSERLLQSGLHLILGGAVGNLIDRFRWGYVVDFLDVYVGRHHWPAFNVADSAICVGITLLFIDMWKKPDTNDQPVKA